MGWHVYNNHAKELGLHNMDDAIESVLDIINNVDHVRLGRDNSYIFSIENGRGRIGKRAVTIVVNSETGEFMGIRTSGYDRIKNLKDRPLLWQRGADSAAEAVATPTVTTIKAQQGDEHMGRTEGQSKGEESKRQAVETQSDGLTSDGKDSSLSADKQISDEESSEATKSMTDEESSSQVTDDKGAGLEQTSVQASVQAASAEVDQNPTDAQKVAGNYKKGHVTIGDFDISIENPAGSVRSGVDANGKKWETKMSNTYGYIKGTESVDGDHIDVFLHTDMDEWNGRKVYVVDQTKPDGSFDEHKVMLGFNNEAEASHAYYANYSKDWYVTHPGIRITGVNIDDFKAWIESSHRKTKPFADYAIAKANTIARQEAKKRYDEAASRLRNPDGTPLTLEQIKQRGKGNRKTTDNLSQKSAENLRGDGYTIEVRKDTRDNSDIYAVKFEERVSRDEFKGQKAIAKKHGGYWSNFGKKGFLFKSEADAKAFAAEVMGKSEDDVADQAPLSMADISDNSDRLIDWEESGPEENPFLNVGVDNTVEQPKPKKRSKWISDEDAAEFDNLRSGLRSHLGTDAPDIVREDAPSYRHKKSRSKNRQDLTTRSEELFAPTSTGSAKLAKINENLRILSGKFQGGKSPYGVITDLATAVGATGTGVSKYSSLVLHNGNEVNIRISNHNATSDNFAERGDFEGNVSIVIKSRRTANTFRPHPDVELMEYVYTTEAIKADGNLLSQVAESLRQMIETGEYVDLSGKALVNRSPETDIVQEDAPSYGKPQPKQMDAEVLRMGTRMTYLMMKGGLRKFSDYAEAMVEEVGDAIRPHLKSLYAAAQNMEEVIDLGWDEEMDDRKTVKSFDVYNFDKPGAKDIIETAQHIVDEQQSQKDTNKLIEGLTAERNEKRKQTEGKTPLATVGNEDYAAVASRAAKMHEEKQNKEKAESKIQKPSVGSLFDNKEEITDQNEEKTDLEVGTGQAGGQRQQREQDTTLGGDESRSETTHSLQP